MLLEQFLHNTTEQKENYYNTDQSYFKLHFA
jgi:hypothetical protein